MPDPDRIVTAEERRTPVHPVKPDPLGSAPESDSVPTGPDGEDVIYVTDDIDPSGHPLVMPRQILTAPHIDGESGREMPEGFDAQKAATTEVDDNPPVKPTAPSPEGVRLESIKRGGQKVELRDPRDDPGANITRTIEGNPTQPLHRTRDEGEAEEEAQIGAQRKASARFKAEAQERAQRKAEVMRSIEQADTFEYSDGRDGFPRTARKEKPKAFDKGSGESPADPPWRESKRVLAVEEPKRQGKKASKPKASKAKAAKSK